MDAKKVFLIGGGLAAAYLISKSVSAVVSNPESLIQAEIKKNAESVKGAFESIHGEGVKIGIYPPDVKFVDWPLYVFIVESPYGLRATVTAYDDTEGSVPDAIEMKSPSTQRFTMIPFPTISKHGKPITKFVFDFPEFAFYKAKVVTVFANALTKTNFNEMLSGKTKYYKINVEA